MNAASGLFVRSPLGIGTGMRYEAVYQCPNCDRLNLASEYSDSATGSGRNGDTNDADRHHWYTPTWLPRHQEVREFRDVPPHIAQAASEATLCLSVGAYRAVGSLARAVIEATAKEKKVGQGQKLAAKIDALHEADHIRKHTKEQAHEIRHFGNDMAHGDFVDPVTKEEAEEVIELMAELLDKVYRSPARLAQRKAAREAKKASESDATG